MFVRKRITLQKTKSSVVRILQRYINGGGAAGCVNEKSFRLYICDTVRYKKLAVMLVVSGTISSIDEQVQVTVKLRPCIAVLLISLFPAAAMLVGLYYLISSVAALPFVLGVLAFNLLFHLNHAWQMRECVSRLVQKLQE